MSKSAPDFPAVASTDLTAIAGGRRSSSSSSSDDRMLDTLNTIESSIKDLGRNANSNASSPMSQLMPILALSMMNQQPTQPAPPQVIYCGGRRRRC